MRNKYKFWLVFSVLVAFIAGLLGGLWGERYLSQKKRRAYFAKPPRESVHFPSLEQMSRELGLSAEQQEEIRQIFERNDVRLKELRSDMHSRLTEIRARLKSELNGVLTAEQQEKFEAMIQNYLLQRKKEFEKRKGDYKRERFPDKPEGDRR
ncbi:MAG: periplasmic heavy metal sensor [Candidatus Aminicenantes bacterium]|nr:periplasmic heavy metal sensor [Candidatus Aminicenantes bacterium]